MDKLPLQSGCYYHIYNRGNNKETIFKEPRNYNHFLLLWRKHVAPVADSFAYSLQPNHFHFLVFIKEDILENKISKGFSNCFNAYSKSINKGYDRTGSLFQERFGREYVNSEKYFTEIILYIHINSQRHGITNDFSTYPYSSYLSLLSDKPTLLKRKEVIDWFGNKKEFISFHRNNMENLIEYSTENEYLKELERLKI